MSAGETDPTRREVNMAGATSSAVSRPMERTGFGQRWSTPVQLWRLGGGLREVKDPSTRTGDQKFSNALIANLPALRRYAVALVGSVAQADELVRGCIELALRESAQLREVPRTAASLRRILHNLYVDELYPSHARSKEEDVSELADRLKLSVPASDRGAVPVVSRAMSQLSVEHRDILLLVYVEELNYREISEELGISPGTVMSRLACAREHLHLLMLAEGAEVKPVQPATMDQS
jgi:RNA polymerase sigma-70 factor, ECF subfamily